MIRGVLLDLSGVLYVGTQRLPGALEAVAELSATGIPLRYITNTTRSPRSAILSKLVKMGLTLDPETLYTAPEAALSHIQARGLRPYLIVHPDLQSEVGAEDSGPWDAVLVGDAGEAFTYGRLNTAFRLLMAGASLYAMADTRYFKEADGLSLDAGPFVAALEYASGVKATVLGKPAASFFHAAAQSMGVAPEEVVMVGDDALSDVQGALAAGMQSILVRTGKYQPGDERRIALPGAVVLDDIGATVGWLLAQR